jgi:hypothetical protein
LTKLNISVKFVFIMLNANVIQGKSKRSLEQLTPAEVEQILQDYRDHTMRVVDVSEKHRVGVNVVITLARRAAIPVRRRGRRSADCPSAFQQKILDAARNETLESVGRRFGRTRQRVAQICKRWSSWFPNGKRDLLLSKKALTVVPSRIRPPRRDEIICFRLASPEVAALKKAMKLSGLPLQLSLGASARAVLLIALIQKGIHNPQGEIVYKK